MTAEAQGQVTELLHRVADGDDSARDQLFRLVYKDLHRQAGYLMAGQKAGHTLQRTALVNEAYLKMFAGGGGRWESRRHFLRVAARAMRQILVDHARRKNAQKNKADLADVDLDRIAAPFEDAVDILALDQALEKLAEEDERVVQVVELRFFAELPMDQIAAVLDTSKRTVERDWSFARLWLRRHLEAVPGSPEDQDSACDD